MLDTIPENNMDPQNVPSGSNNSDQQSLINQQREQINQLNEMLKTVLISQMIPEAGDHLNRSGHRARPQLRREHLDLIPQFSGHVETLHEFLQTTQKLHDRFHNEDDPEDFQNYMLFAGIKSKIIPPASTQVFATNPTTYKEIRETLVNTYTDRRDDVTLLIELTKIRQMENENPFRYHDRIQKTLNTLIAYIQNHNPENLEMATTYFQRVALRVFLLNLKEPLGQILRTRQPADMGSALCMLTNDYQTMVTHPKQNKSQTNNTPQNQKSYNGYNKNPQYQNRYSANDQPNPNFKSNFGNQYNQGARNQNQTPTGGNPNQYSYRPQNVSNFKPQNQQNSNFQQQQKTNPQSPKPNYQQQRRNSEPNPRTYTSGWKPNTNFNNIESDPEETPVDDQNYPQEPDHSPDTESIPPEQYEDNNYFLGDPSLESPDMN